MGVDYISDVYGCQQAKSSTLWYPLLTWEMQSRPDAYVFVAWATVPAYSKQWQLNLHVASNTAVAAPEQTESTVSIRLSFFDIEMCFDFCGHCFLKLSQVVQVQELE